MPKKKYVSGLAEDPAFLTMPVFNRVWGGKADTEHADFRSATTVIVRPKTVF